MRILTIIIFLIYCTNLTAQVETYIATQKVNECGKIEEINSIIGFSDTAVMITDWVNGGKEPLTLMVKATTEKLYAPLSITAKWYYCYVPGGDHSSNPNFIIIKDLNGTWIEYNQKLDEVTYIKYDLTCAKQ